MSKVVFKYPCDVAAEDRITGFAGTIIVRCESINGAITYGIQPRKKKEDSDYVPDAQTVDEDYITGPDAVADEVDFKFDCGDRVHNIINGFSGVVVKRKHWLNGCIQYDVEGPMVKTEISGMTSQIKTFWEQELEAVKKSKPVKTEKKRTGGPSARFCSMGKV